MGIRIAGPGSAWITRTDVPNWTPVNFMGVKEVTLDWDFGIKGLTGGTKLPIDFMAGETKITGKIKTAGFSPILIAAMSMGALPALGSMLTQYKEAGVVPAAGAPLVVANGATFVNELEVLNILTDQPFIKVPAAPAAGQYAVAAGGSFTFAAGDAGKAILTTYNYTSAGGYSLSLNNSLQGDAPTFAVTIYNKKNGLPVNYTLPYVVANKFSRQFKENDFMNPEIDIMVGANAAGVALTENYAILT